LENVFNQNLRLITVTVVVVIVTAGDIANLPQDPSSPPPHQVARTAAVAPVDVADLVLQLRIKAEAADLLQDPLHQIAKAAVVVVVSVDVADLVLRLG
jgi:hypothetical protein